MTVPPDRPKEDLPPELSPGEAELLAATAKTLEDSRPLPRPEFRGRLRRDLAKGGRGAAPRWQPLAASYAAIGAALLAVAAIGLTGAGPFGLGS